jgi:O-antigen/teichoic acid export membrane protein
LPHYLKTISGSFLKLFSEGRTKFGESSRRFFKNFTISSIGSVCGIVISLGRTVLLTKSLSLPDYGKILIIPNIFLFLSFLWGIRIPDIIFRFYPKFRQDEDEALQGLIILCFIIELVKGGLIGLGVLVLAPWIGQFFYSDPTISFPLQIFAFAVLFNSLLSGGMVSAVLRIHDCFSHIVLSQVFGNLLVLSLLFFYFRMVGDYSLSHVVSILGIGIIVPSFFPALKAFRILRKNLCPLCLKQNWSGLKKHRRELYSVFSQTSLVSYLKVLFSPGDIFLLGIFSSSKEVALYGLARQLIGPLAMLQNNIQVAITPEIISSWAKKQYIQLYSFIRNFLKIAVFPFIFVVVVIGGDAMPAIIEWFSKPEYLEAIPVLNFLFLAAWLSFITIVFYPLGLASDMISRYNISQLCAVLIFIPFLGFAKIDAIRMAFVQIGSICFILAFFCLPVFLRIRREAGK